MKTFNTNRCRLLAGICLTCLGAVPAFAQQASGGAGGGVQEVVVTAQKREQTVQSTPATVTVLTPTTLTNYRVTDLLSIQRLVPGFQFEYITSQATMTIRGFGTTAQGQTLEQAVAPYLNGVYLGGWNRDFSWPLFDVDHIEVFKGTQSGIAGQSTSVGMIDITTKKPGDKFGGYVQGGGEFVNGGYNAEGAVDLPANDKFKVRLSGYYNNRGGWVHDAVTGNDLGHQITWAGRFNALWAPSDNVTAQFYGEYDHLKQIGAENNIIISDPTGAYTNSVAPYFAWRPGILKSSAFSHDWDPNVGVNYDGNDGILADSFKGSARFDVQLGKFALTSITAGSVVNERLSTDNDYSQADIPTAANPGSSQWSPQTNDYHQITEELRLSSPKDERLSYIAGLWYRHSKEALLAEYFVATGLPTLPLPGRLAGTVEPFHQTTNNASAYLDAEFKLTDKLTFGGALRYTHETKDAEVRGDQFPGLARGTTFVPFPTFRSDQKFSFWDGSARLTYVPAENLHFYALYSHGTKTGALISAVAGGQPAIALPEVAETYEVGAKTDLFDRRVSIDVSLFRMLVHNYQDVFTRRANGVVVFIAQNTDVRTNGLDAQINWRATSALTLALNAEFLDAQNTTLGGRFIRSPKWTIGGNARYEFEMFGMRSALFGNALYKTRYYNQARGQASRMTTITPAYVTVDIGAEIHPTEKISLSLLCKDCTNELVKIRPNFAGFGPTAGQAQYIFTPELRTISLQLKYQF